MTDDRPSITELQEQLGAMTPGRWEIDTDQRYACDAAGICALHAAAPAIPVAVAAALAYNDAECTGTRCSHPAHMMPCAILTAGAAFRAALAKVRP
jgi:hypothetical protein